MQRHPLLNRNWEYIPGKVKGQDSVSNQFSQGSNDSTATMHHMQGSEARNNPSLQSSRIFVLETTPSGDDQ